MEWLFSTLTVLLGLLVRIILPVAVTLGLIYVLKRLDERWRVDAEKTAMPVLVRNAGCWTANQCSAEKRAVCDAYAHPEVPCWQYYRQKNQGMLPETCLGCKIFRGAPLPQSS